MGIPSGHWYIDDTLTFTVNTHDVATGAGTDADGVPTYRIYENETGTAILTGSMAKLDDASTVGFYSEQITLSAANGFENNKSYAIYVAATVDGIAATQSFNFRMISFTVDANILSLLGTPIPTPNNAGVMEVDVTHWLGTAAATPSVAGVPEVDITHFGGTAGTFASGRPEVNTTLIEGVDATNQAQAAAAAALTAYDPPTHAELTSGLAAADDAVLAQVALVKASTDNLPSDPADQSLIIAATSALAAAISALNNLSSAQVQTAAAAALTAYDPPTNAEMEARTIAAADYLVAADIANLEEQLDEIWRLLGLDSTDPVTITPSAITATGISIGITGDGETTSTLTRA